MDEQDPSIRAPRWTDFLPKSEHTELFLHADYDSTTLGPISAWGPTLRSYTSMVFADSRPAIVYWGPDKIAFYNEKAVDTLQEAHPSLMARSFYEVFSELSTSMRPVFDQAASSGQSVEVDNVLLFVQRNGYMEETNFVGSFVPIRGDDFAVDGFYNTYKESTAEVLHARRRQVLDQIAASTPTSVDETLSGFFDALRTNPHDITAALLYSYDELASEGAPNLKLCGNIGFTVGHDNAPLEAHLETGQNGLQPWFRRVRSTGEACVLRPEDDNCRSLFDAVSWCGFAGPPRGLVVHVLSISGTLLGFYVQGINPRRPYDDAMRSSIADIVRQMEVKWINARATEQAQLRERLLEQRATVSENRLRHMAQNAPLGMMQMGRDHCIRFANQQYYDILGMDSTMPNVSGILEALAPDEQEHCLRVTKQLMDGGPRIVEEFRLKRSWRCPDNREHSAWILGVCFPVIEDNEVEVVMIYVLDISHQKWAEDVQMRNAAAARLAKQRQEEFIDVTSHEMRNPLGAITQLADGISRSLLANVTNEPHFWQGIAQESASAADTILACAAHLKRVVDDVLILSRLEGNMLSICPIVAQPAKVVSETIKMFSGEARLIDASLSASRADAYGVWTTDWALIDTSRLTQILINLVSNAIKFTASRSTRQITILYGQSTQRHQRLQTPFGELEWLPPKMSIVTNASLSDPVDGQERLYLYFVIQDTGPGLTSDQMGGLFQRFAQASNRTHVDYGGTGLGLFICRELAEKQGGGVGVASCHGEGSAFGFYIESRAATAEVPQHILAEVSKLDLEASPTVTANAVPRRMSSQLEHANGGPLTILSNGSIRLPTVLNPSEAYHILLVEDNLINQRVLAKQLRMAKCQVTVANNGVEALKLLERATCWQQTPSQRLQSGDQSDYALDIQIVLMDVEMPIMDGLQCSRQIRVLESTGQITRHLPIIATTANVRQEQKDIALAAGVDSVLSKPFTVAEVLAQVKVALVRGDKQAPPKEPAIGETK
ncbi:hypothetical protein LTR56_004602 [Elasticomyces elasticus]|nr:hypothetical protein LTR56_004602 [Elasticomyces elasticus]KAK3659878.1 hypothetical protein LTR22_008245 [Elasticomyces elasticus]KAK4925941.1 hypothetical protein LTR49_007079 [Elasticomyces elasticus]KAK5768178.1 hypothetical protein LTS12_001662 [Elasticomyces elasticus]